MVPELRKIYNDHFSAEKYHAFLTELDSHYPGAREFRLAETPVFIPKAFSAKMFSACESIIDLITDPRFIPSTDSSIPLQEKVAGPIGHPQMIVFDFGICHGENDLYIPQLVEMQGFPSLYAFQSFFPDILRKHFSIPDNYTQYLNGHTKESFTELFREIILGGHQPKNVVLLEIKPNEQKTRIDFYCTRDMTGIQPVCISELIAENNELFYWRDGKKTKINRIFNRLIFDELHEQHDLSYKVDIRRHYDVEWVPHPDWFYRISKYTLPMLSHPYVPETFFLNEIKQLPGNLNDYVLKPLFSFAGQGVVIDVTTDDVDRIHDPENWILQKKVQYADVIVTPDEPAKAEIRLMYLWKDGDARPQPVINLARLSKGKMIGTRYNKDKQWVGGSVAFFEH